MASVQYNEFVNIHFIFIYLPTVADIYWIAGHLFALGGLKDRTPAYASGLCKAQMHRISSGIRLKVIFHHGQTLQLRSSHESHL